jgi:hypothetical protein
MTVKAIQAPWGVHPIWRVPTPALPGSPDNPFPPKGEGQGEGKGIVRTTASSAQHERFGTGRRLRFRYGYRFLPPHPNPLPRGEGGRFPSLQPPHHSVRSSNEEEAGPLSRRRVPG